MKFPSFRQSLTPHIILKPGALDDVGRLAAGLGHKVLLITGGRSFVDSGNFDHFAAGLEKARALFTVQQVHGEPSPQTVDAVVEAGSFFGADVVVSVGGGSVLDTGKAAAAMMTIPGSVRDYLEGIGTKSHPGTTLPHIAVPTTAGTGSEATKNAVISETGDNGFKRSLRHDNFVPRYAILDPRLYVSCPPHTTAACGMDAFTQLLESYVSTRATPFTDALAVQGIRLLLEFLPRVVHDDPGDIDARAACAYAATLSGITLANAGLGIVHGLAGIGSIVPIPHGVVCGTLVGEAMRITIARLRDQGDAGTGSLEKFADIGRIVGKGPDADSTSACDLLVDFLHSWIDRLKIPRLGAFGVNEDHLDTIVKKADNKNNPVKLTPADIRKLVRSRF